MTFCAAPNFLGAACLSFWLLHPFLDGAFGQVGAGFGCAFGHDGALAFLEGQPLPLLLLFLLEVSGVAGVFFEHLDIATTGIAASAERQAPAKRPIAMNLNKFVFITLRLQIYLNVYLLLLVYVTKLIIKCYDFVKLLEH